MNYYLMDGGVDVCCTTVGAHEYDLEIVIVELGSTGVSFVVLEPLDAVCCMFDTKGSPFFLFLFRNLLVISE